MKLLNLISTHTNENLSGKEKDHAAIVWSSKLEILYKNCVNFKRKNMSIVKHETSALKEKHFE